MDISVLENRNQSSRISKKWIVLVYSTLPTPYLNITVGVLINSVYATYVQTFVQNSFLIINDYYIVCSIIKQFMKPCCPYNGPLCINSNTTSLWCVGCSVLYYALRTVCMKWSYSTKTTYFDPGLAKSTT